MCVAIMISERRVNNSFPQTGTKDKKKQQPKRGECHGNTEGKIEPGKGLNPAFTKKKETKTKRCLNFANEQIKWEWFEV